MSVRGHWQKWVVRILFFLPLPGASYATSVFIFMCLFQTLDASPVHPIIVSGAMAIFAATLVAAMHQSRVLNAGDVRWDPPHLMRSILVTSGIAIGICVAARFLGSLFITAFNGDMAVSMMWLAIALGTLWAGPTFALLLHGGSKQGR